VVVLPAVERWRVLFAKKLGFAPSWNSPRIARQLLNKLSARSL
jgi:hypothetical protein